MMNRIWVGMIFVGMVAAALNPNVGLDVVASASVSAGEQAVTVAFGLIGILAFWSGMMRVAQEAGLMQWIARLLTPVGRRLFPSLPEQSPAMGAVLLALSANMLGLGNAATPLGLKAMEELQALNPNRTVASDAMCTFLALTTAGITLIPTTVVALRAAQGSSDPTAIVATTLFATTFGTSIAVLFDRFMLRRGLR